MDNRLEKLEELNKLNKSGHVSDEEYKTLLAEILDTNLEKNEKNDNTENNGIVNHLKEAGRNVMIIYYVIVVEIIVSQIHNLLIDVKTKYLYKTNENFDAYAETNVFTKQILDMKNIDDIVEYVDNLNKIYYFIQLVLFISFMHCLWNIGKNLKSIE